LILPPIKSVLGETGDPFVLIKPQFECENKNIGNSGIVHLSAHGDIVEKVVAFAGECGLYPFGIINAPLRKGKNVEYVLWLKPTYHGAILKETIVSWVKTFVKEGIRYEEE
jgi:predicted rRNA methylase YqxC with S4 and FtsJ domains